MSRFPSIKDKPMEAGDVWFRLPEDPDQKPEQILVLSAYQDNLKWVQLSGLYPEGRMYETWRASNDFHDYRFLRVATTVDLVSALLGLYDRLQNISVSF